MPKVAQNPIPHNFQRLTYTTIRAFTHRAVVTEEFYDTVLFAPEAELDTFGLAWVEF